MEGMKVIHMITLNVTSVPSGAINMQNIWKLLKKVAHTSLPIATRQSLLTIYKSFIRPHLDYGDVVYDQPHNETFCSKLESGQYNAALAITGTICGTSQTKLYVELGLESLKARCWFRRLCYFYECKSYWLPPYLFQLIPHESHSYSTNNSEDIPTHHCRTDSFNNSFFSSTIRKWNKLDLDFCKSPYSVIRQYLLKVIWPQPSATFNVCNFAGLRLLTRLRFGLSHLNDHRFNHNFQNYINPLRTCSLEVESTSHFFLHCLYYNDVRETLLNEFKSLYENILKLSGNKLFNLLLYGDSKFDPNKNTRLLNAAIKYVIDSERFTVPHV